MADPGFFGSSAVIAFQQIAAAPEAMLRAASDKRGALLDLAAVFLTIAFLTEFVTTVYQWWLGGSLDKFLGAVFRLVIIVSIPVAALASWESASSLIPKYMQQTVGSKLSNSANPLELIEKMIGVVDKYGKSVFDAISKDRTATPAAPTSPPSTLTGMAVSGLMNGVSYLEKIGEGIGNTVTAFAAMALFMFLVGLPMMILSFVLLANVFGFQILAYVGVIVGPLMIAWLPWQPMSWLFMSWIKYMLIAGLSYAIAMLLGSIAQAGTIQLTNALLASFDLREGLVGTVFALLPMFTAVGATLLFMAWIIHKSEDVAQALIGGGGAGGGGFMAIMSRTIQRSRSGGKSGGGNDKPTPDKPTAKPPEKQGIPAGSSPANPTGGNASNQAAAASSTPSKK